MASGAAAQQTQTASDIDWVDWEQLSTEQRAQAADNCCGIYVQPPLLAPEQLNSAQPNAMILEAINLDYNEEGIVNLKGGVRAYQQGLLITSDNGSYNKTLQIAELEGNVQVREENLLLIGEYGSSFNQSGRIELNEASYVLHDTGIRGSADIIMYVDDEGIITINNGQLSRCEPGNNAWTMAAKSIELNQNTGRGVARGAVLKIKDVPVFYTPWLSFPINDERVSGFLSPSFGTTSGGGVDISAPYYFNLAPNFDATYTPRFMSDRGLQHGIEFRHLNNSSKNRLSVAYLPTDDHFDPAVLSQIEAAQLAGDSQLLNSLDSAPRESRWIADIDHQGRLGQRWSTYVNYLGVSDLDYFQDFGRDGVSQTAPSYLTRQGHIRYNGNNWRMTSSLTNFQLIDPFVSTQQQPHNLVPEISVNGDFSTQFNIDYGIDIDYTYFDRDLGPEDFTQSQINSGQLVTGGRLSIEPKISYTWSNPGMFITPTLEYLYASYTLEDQANNTSDNPDRGIFRGSIDSGLFFDRDIELFGNQYTQTLEPRLYYLYADYEDQSQIPIFDSSIPTFSAYQLFRPNSFSGRDRIADADQTTLALSTRFLDTSGREKAKASIGQIFYFSDRRVSLYNPITAELNRNTSSIVSELDYRFSDNWNIRSYLEWNSTDNSIDVGSFQFRYQSDIKQILNFGLQFRDDPRPISAEGIDPRIVQSQVSGSWPITENLGVVAKINYDHANDRNLDSLIGFEYSSCCWNSRIVYREWMDIDSFQPINNGKYDYGLFLQFELKGFGNLLGGNVQNILANSISGYPSSQ